ncbi:putrescine-ornithine antiporter [Paraburkholderia caffeinilytica]|uniref:putrescine-ornithine antiporter n=1 Tax=Paraburkholderia caffeinilytica TaxID=1761016 RepID=UPI003DA0360F
MSSSRPPRMGVAQLTVLTVINMMGSGIIMLPTQLAQVGTVSITSWIVTVAGSLVLAYVFSRCGRFSRKGGGMGGYAEYSFGKPGNFLTNYTYGVSLVIANIAIATSIVGYMAAFFQMSLSPLQVGIGTIGILWAATVLNFGGPRMTGHLGSIAIWGIVLPVIGISVAGWFWFNPAIYMAAWNPHELPILQAISASISVTLWAFLGLESACANADSVENPERNVPIAVMVGTLITAVIYIASTNVIAGIVPNMQLMKSNAPFGLVFAHIFNPTVGRIIIAMMVVSCFGSLLGWQFTVGQVFKSSADEGYFIKLFGLVTAKTNTPVIGMVAITTVQTALSLLTISPSLQKQFNILLNLAVVTNLAPYILSMSAAEELMRSTSLPKKTVTTTAAIAFIGNLYSFYALYSAGQEAVYWGGMVVLFGFLLYGKTACKFGLPQPTVVTSGERQADRLITDLAAKTAALVQEKS